MIVLVGLLAFAFGYLLGMARRQPDEQRLSPRRPVAGYQPRESPRLDSSNIKRPPSTGVSRAPHARARSNINHRKN